MDSVTGDVLLTTAGAIGREFKDLYNFRWVVFSFVYSNLRLRYKRSVIGILWSMLGPIFNYLVMGTVFSILMRNSNPQYFAHLFSGAALYNMMAAIVSGSPGILIGNEGYIKKIYIPKTVFFSNVLLSELVNFSFNIIALFFLGCVTGHVVLSLSWLALPLIVFMALLFTLGIAIGISILTIYFRDVNHILPILMQAAFFGTPILYFVQDLPKEYQELVYFNPLFYWVEAFRAPILYAAWPSLKTFAVLGGMSALSLLFGVFLLIRFDNRIVFKL